MGEARCPVSKPTVLWPLVPWIEDARRPARPCAALLSVVTEVLVATLQAMGG